MIRYLNWIFYLGASITLVYGVCKGAMPATSAKFMILFFGAVLCLFEYLRWRDGKVPRMTIEEALANEPMPLCGDKKYHYTQKWNGNHCMKCRSIRAEQEEADKEERMARLIAAEVVKQMNKDAK